MNFKDRVSAFEELGVILSNSASNSDFHKILKSASLNNYWFTRSNVMYAVQSLSKWLNQATLFSFISHYNLTDSNKKIGVIIPSNIPFVGFHDFLCVLLSGNTFIGQLSSHNNVLLPYIANLLFGINKDFKNLIFFSNNIKNVDMIIATGSDNSAVYFDYHHFGVPKIIRKNRNSIAIISGFENPKDYLNLALDVYMYFGLGCRSVSKLFLPRGFNIEILRPYFKQIGQSFYQTDYLQNYTYQKSIFILNSIMFFDFHNLLLVESRQINSSLSVLYYEYYDNIQELKDKIHTNQEKIQCVLSNDKSIKNALYFGSSQQPRIDDFPDGVDVIDCINSI